MTPTTDSSKTPTEDRDPPSPLSRTIKVVGEPVPLADHRSCSAVLSHLGGLSLEFLFVLCLLLPFYPVAMLAIPLGCAGISMLVFIGRYVDDRHDVLTYLKARPLLALGFLVAALVRGTVFGAPLLAFETLMLYSTLSYFFCMIGDLLCGGRLIMRPPPPPPNTRVRECVAAAAEAAAAEKAVAQAAAEMVDAVIEKAAKEARLAAEACLAEQSHLAVEAKAAEEVRLADLEAGQPRRAREQSNDQADKAQRYVGHESVWEALQARTEVPHGKRNVRLLPSEPEAWEASSCSTCAQWSS